MILVVDLVESGQVILYSVDRSVAHIDGCEHEEILQEDLESPVPMLTHVIKHVHKSRRIR